MDKHEDWCEYKDIDQSFLDDMQALYESVRSLKDNDDIAFCYCPMCGVEIDE